MTAVEWLQQQQKELLNQVKSGEFKIEDFEYYNALYIEQAKEMEKEQKESFYKIGYLDGESKVRNFNENIYKETFKSE